MNKTTVVQIGLILPDVMGTYGDSGNAVVLCQRLIRRGIPAEVIPIMIGDPVPDSLDLYTLGGAEDSAQQLATRHLLSHSGLQRAVNRGAPVLAICAGLQILGSWYQIATGQQITGLELLDITTVPQTQRAIGEVLSIPLMGEVDEPLTGFENHRGATFLGQQAKALGTVSYGCGNSPESKFEGVIQGSVIATYLHGPCLARNPQLADALLSQVVGDLSPLEIPEVNLLRHERLTALGYTTS